MDLDREVDQMKDSLIKAVQDCIRVRSVKAAPAADAPFGAGVRDCLNWTLNLGKELGFEVKNLDGYAGHIDMGAGELVGILGHLDVVPEGEGWSFPPYEATIHDGKIYGRGATDDKGPSIAALFAMKALKNAHVPLNKKIRLILGTDEESGWADMDYYFQKEEKPQTGFSPDAEFPLIHAEKGILHLEMAQNLPSFPHLMEITGGERANIVPAQCKIRLKNLETSSVQDLLEAQDFPAGITWDFFSPSKHEIFITFNGLSAHGSLPQDGLNAVIYGLDFLQTLPLSPEEHEFIAWILAHPGHDPYGEGFGIALADDVSGRLSLNLGIFKLTHRDIHLTLDIRYPVSYSEQDVLPVLSAQAREAGYEVRILSHQLAHHVPKDSKLVRTLLKAYEKYTGQAGEARAIGGGTYAKALPQGVAFGPEFPGEPEKIHCPDEYIDIDNLVLMTKIYAQAIYNLLTD